MITFDLPQWIAFLVNRPLVFACQVGMESLSDAAATVIQHTFAATQSRAA